MSLRRQGIEGTISQGVRVFSLRRARHRSWAKTGLQSVVTAAAMDLDRFAAWFPEGPLTPRRTSRFAALVGWPATSPTGSPWMTVRLRSVRQSRSATKERTD